MTAYGVARDGFWEGNTGRDIARLGGKDAQLLALYLFKNPDDNMIGLYQLNLGITRRRINTVTMTGLVKSFSVLAQCEFAEYDTISEHVWVRELAKYRLGIYKTAIGPKDNRVKHALSLYERAKPNPFLEPFFRRYRRDLHIPKARRFEGISHILGRDSEGASNTDNSDQIADSSKQLAGREQKTLARQEHAPAPTRQLLSQFDELHQLKVHARARIVPGKDAKLLAELWRSHGELVPELMALFFAQNGDFIRGAGYTVGVFSSQFGKLLTLRAETLGHLPGREPEKPSHSRTGDTLEAGKASLRARLERLQAEEGAQVRRDEIEG